MISSTAMVAMLRCPAARLTLGWNGAVSKWALILLACVGMLSRAWAQAPQVHYRHRGVTPPGAIGSWQLQRGGPLQGYFQPVEIQAPPGTRISLAEHGRFDEPLAAPRLVGLLIAPVYRFRVTHIPLNEGVEVFPTVEVIDRLYPPAGQAWRFPIPVELTQQEIEMALDGKFVTRIIYLEDPAQALPAASDPRDPTLGSRAPTTTPWFDVAPGENPVQVADSLGRPVAILRMGGRIPLEEPGGADGQPCDSPPFLNYAAPVIPVKAERAKP